MHSKVVSAILAVHLLFVPAFVFADDEALSLDDPDVKACVEARFNSDGREQVTEELLNKGTFLLLIRECVNQRRSEVQKSDKHWRLQQRAQQVLNRLKRNSRSAVTHFSDVSVDPVKAMEKRQQTVQDAYRNRNAVDPKSVVVPAAVRQPIMRGVVTNANRIKAVQQPTEQPVAGWRTYQGDAPSRRQLQSGGSLSNQVNRQESSDLFQQRQQEAIATCKHLQNSFARENCIRSKMRTLGK